jgi:hypothetical protein
MNAQVCLHILQKIALLSPDDFMGVKDVNDLDHMPQDVETGFTSRE